MTGDANITKNIINLMLNTMYPKETDRIIKFTKKPIEKAPRIRVRFECFIFFMAIYTEGRKTRSPNMPRPLIFSKLFPSSKYLVSEVIVPISYGILNNAKSKETNAVLILQS